nr:hypothetical protein [Tanacetum cinerariifolium]
MSTQQDIYAANFENRPPMLNKENYVSWSSHLLRYAKSRPNTKLIYNSIMNGPYVKRMIPEPVDPNREVPVPEKFHEQIDDELMEAEIKQMEVDDQAIQTILIPEDICATVDSCETAQEVDDLRAERLAKTQDSLALMAISNNPFNYPVFHPYLPSSSTYLQQPQPNKKYNSQPSFNQNYMQQPMPNLKDITDPTTAMNMELVLMAKAFKLNYSKPTNNNQKISSNPHNRKIAQLENQNGYNAVQNVRNQVAQNAIQNMGVQNVRNQNGLIVVSGIVNQNPNRNGNVVVAWAEARIQLQGEEFNLMAVAADLDEIEEVNANCILMANLQQALTSGTQTDKAPIYDSDGSAEEFSNLNNQLSKVKSIVSFLQEERKKLKNDFKTLEDELLDKQILLENRIKEFDNILVKTSQSIQTMHMLSPKPDLFYHTEQEMDLGYQNPFYLKQAQKKQQSLYNGKVLLEKHDPPAVYDSEETL